MKRVTEQDQASAPASASAHEPSPLKKRKSEGSDGPEQRSHTATVESGPLRAVATVMDGGAIPGGIATGICFLNHMIDQLTAHGQLAIVVQVSLDGLPFVATADYTGDPAALRPHDETIFRIVGDALGQCLGGVLGEWGVPMARFCSPLDEGEQLGVAARLKARGAAFSEVVIEQGAECGLEFNLAPYGAYPATGRRWIGRYRCDLTSVLWEGVATGLNCSLKLRKVRGDNAHHIVEASFKSLGRALRAVLDINLPAALLPTNPLRKASRKRETKETSIDVQVAIGSTPAQHVETGVITLNQMVAAFGASAGLELTVQVVMDLSNRPGCFSNLALQHEMVGDMSAEMVVHFFESIASSTRVGSFTHKDNS